MDVVQRQNSTFDSINGTRRSSFEVSSTSGTTLATSVPSVDNIGVSPKELTDKIKTDKDSPSTEETKARNAQIANSINTNMQALSGVINAQTQLASIDEAAETNIYLANYRRSLILNEGMQAALDRQMEGEQIADKALLSLAAQGQNVSGAAANKVAASYRAVALQNAMREELKMYAQVAGIDAEIADIEFQTSMAEANADTALYQGILNSGLSIAGQYAGG